LFFISFDVDWEQHRLKKVETKCELAIAEVFQTVCLGSHEKGKLRYLVPALGDLLDRGASAPRVRTSSPHSPGSKLRCTSKTAAKVLAVRLMRIGPERLDFDGENTKADEQGFATSSLYKKLSVGHMYICLYICMSVQPTNGTAAIGFRTRATLANKWIARRPGFPAHSDHKHSKDLHARPDQVHADPRAAQREAFELIP